MFIVISFSTSRLCVAGKRKENENENKKKDRCTNSTTKTLRAKGMETELLYAIYKLIFLCLIHKIDDFNIVILLCRNWKLFGLVILVTFATRFYKVTEPDHVW